MPDQLNDLASKLARANSVKNETTVEVGFYKKFGRLEQDVILPVVKKLNTAINSTGFEVKSFAKKLDKDDDSSTRLYHIVISEEKNRLDLLNDPAVFIDAQSEDNTVRFQAPNTRDSKEPLKEIKINIDNFDGGTFQNLLISAIENIALQK